MANKFDIKNETFEDVRIIRAWSNFAGLASKYNSLGNRNFVIELPGDMALDMEQKGWNVKTRQSKEEGEPDWYTLQITFKFNKDNPRLNPRIILIQGKKQIPLTEDNIDILDNIDIQTADLTIRPYSWEVNGNSGVKAYVDEMYVIQNMTDLSAKYMDYGYEEECPF